MKFKIYHNKNEKSLNIPLAALVLSGIDLEEPVELHVMDQLLAVIPKELTAMEVIQAMDGLLNLMGPLADALFDACGECGGCEKGCPEVDPDEEAISLPDFVREKLGIPEDAKLCAELNEAEGTATISEAGYDYDLRDVPPDMLELLKTAGLCVGELERLLMEGVIVYGMTKN